MSSSTKSGFRTLVARLARRFRSTTSSAAPQRPAFRPTFEGLEERALMASTLTASVSGGLLFIEGTEKADTITVRQQNNRLSVDGTLILVNGVRLASVPVGNVTGGV